MKYRYQSVLIAASRFLSALSFKEYHARLTAKHYLEAEVRGYPSQGLLRLREVERFVHAGLIDPFTRRRLSRTATATAVIQAHGALGPPVARAAVLLAVRLAQQYGIGLVGSLGAGHIGYLTPFAEMAARKGMVVIATSISAPAVSLPYSSAKILGTNPIAYAFPVGESVFCSDFSLAMVSRGEVLRKQAAGESFSRAVGYDKDGAPTSTPDEVLSGSIAPIDNSIKGFALNLLMSVLAGPMIGGIANTKIKGTRWPDGMPNKGDLFICFRLTRAAGSSDFQQEMNELIYAISSASDSFHIPGEHSRKRLETASISGVELGQDIAQMLNL